MRTFLPSTTPTDSMRLVVVLTLIMTVLTACGYRGPLYLPDESPPPATTESSAEPSEPVGIDDSIEVESDQRDDEDEGRELPR